MTLLRSPAAHGSERLIQSPAHRVDPEMNNAHHEQPVFQHALIVGASGGIGQALLPEIASRPMAARITGWSRQPPESMPPIDGWQQVDITDEASIERAARALGGVDLVIVATGMLHGPGHQPEKTFRAMDAAAMAHAFAINTIGPALVAKHVLPYFPRDKRAVFAALSARVGSIGDNRLGGWYSYRASKAALNQIIRTLSIELRLTHPQAVAIGLHPGTVDTGLSKPFQARVPNEALTSPQIAAARLLDVLSTRTAADSGRVFDWRGEVVPE